MKRESAVAASRAQPPNTPPAIAPAGGLEAADDKRLDGAADGVTAGLATRDDASSLVVALDVNGVAKEDGAPNEEGTLSARDEIVVSAVVDAALDVEAIFGCSWTFAVFPAGGEKMIVSTIAILCEVVATAGTVNKDGAVFVTAIFVVLSGDEVSVLSDVEMSVLKDVAAVSNVLSSVLRARAVLNVLSSVLRSREVVRVGGVWVVVDAVDVVEEVSAEDLEELVDVSEVNELEEIEVDELVEVTEVDKLRLVLERDVEIEEVLPVDELSEEISD